MVALSRWLPLFPEVLSCMAGLVAMPAWRFFGASACGSFPLGFAFAAIGATGGENVPLALALSAAVPAILYGAAALLWRRHRLPPGAGG
jgi:membrane protein DedA with SNARE-associated domain